MGQKTIITPTVTVTESYNSNSLFSEEGKDDWNSITTISPNMSFTRGYTKGTLSGSAGVGLEYFPDRSDLNSETYNAGLNFNIMLTSKTNFTFNERFSFSPDSLELSSDTFSDTDTGIQVERNDTLSNSLSLSIDHSLSSAVSIGLTVSDNRTEYESPLSDIRSNSIAPVLNIDKALTSKTSLDSSYNFTRFYSERDGGNKVRDAHSLLLGFNHRFMPDFSLKMSGGVVYTPESGFHYDVIGNTAFTRSTKMSRMSLGYSRKIATTSGLSDDLSMSQGLSFNLTSALTRYLSLSMNAGIHSNKSETSNSVDLLSYNAGVSGSWQPYTWMSVGIGYSHFQQEKESDTTKGEALSRDSVFLSIKVTPAVWRL
ncbi:MAG: hypothetical protein ACE5IH_01595 [Thermodesulfobacteriota bacterium]